jgi:hypothetical protein
MRTVSRRRAFARAFGVSAALIIVVASAPTHAQAPAQPAATQPASPKADSPAVDRSSFGVWPVSPVWLDVTGQSNEKILSSITPSGPWRIDFGPQNGCPTCDATRLQPPTNANGPWALKAGISYVGTDAEVTATGTTACRSTCRSPSVRTTT